MCITVHSVNTTLTAAKTRAFHDILASVSSARGLSRTSGNFPANDYNEVWEESERVGGGEREKKKSYLTRRYCTYLAVVG